MADTKVERTTWQDLIEADKKARAAVEKAAAVHVTPEEIAAAALMGTALAIEMTHLSGGMHLFTGITALAAVMKGSDVAERVIKEKAERIKRMTPKGVDEVYWDKLLYD